MEQTLRERASWAAEQFQWNVPLGTVVSLRCSKWCGGMTFYRAEEEGWKIYGQLRRGGREACRQCASAPSAFPYATDCGEAAGCPRPGHDVIKAGLAPRFFSPKVVRK